MATPLSGKTAKIVLDKKWVAKLAGMGCTQKEIAAFFECSVDTLTRNFAESLNLGVDKGKVSVRRLMWAQGRKGNSVALKYLVHNILKEKIEEYTNTVIANDDPLAATINNISTEMILKIVKAHENKVC